MNLDCKVDEFEPNYGKLYIDTLDRVDIVYPAKINDFWGINRGIYEDAPDGIISILKTKKSTRMSAKKAKVRNINNLNAHQRLVIKKLRQTLAKFHATTFSCNGCIHQNDYLLKGVCYHYKKRSY